MIVDENTNIGQLVAKDYHAASVFRKHNIDFCCNGNRSISEANEGSVNIQELINELNHELNAGHNSGIDVNGWPLDLLIDYILKKHHRYVESKIPEIKFFLDKLVNVHGDKHPELMEIRQLFFASADDLTTHMKKEELVLFPNAIKIDQASELNVNNLERSIQIIEHAVLAMQHEHNEEGERFRKIAKLTNNYKVPADGCATYATCFAMLNEFEQDLHHHIHLENNVLFPKALELSKNLNSVID